MRRKIIGALVAAPLALGACSAADAAAPSADTGATATAQPTLSHEAQVIETERAITHDYHADVPRFLDAVNNGEDVATVTDLAARAGRDLRAAVTALDAAGESSEAVQSYIDTRRAGVTTDLAFWSSVARMDSLETIKAAMQTDTSNGLGAFFAQAS